MTHVRVTDFESSLRMQGDYDHVIGLLGVADRKYLEKELREVPNRSMFWFDDVQRDTSYGEKAPTDADIKSIIQTIKEKGLDKRDKKVLVHCAMGISRSTATAISLLIMRGFTIERSFNFIWRARPQLHPSKIMLEHFDNNLGLDGKLVEHVERWKVECYSRDRMGFMMSAPPVFDEQVD
jgi:predicted protein tyrosine phosphatase